MRVLTVHLNQIGDLLFSLPALKCIRDSFSEVRLTAAVRQNCAPLMRLTGLADEIVVRSRSQGQEKMRLRRRLRDEGYDIALTFSRSLDCLLMVRATRARVRGGFYRFGAGLALNRTLPFSVPPSTENNLRLVQHLGLKITATNYVGLVRPDGGSGQGANEILESVGVLPTDKLVVLAPGASTKRSIKAWTDDGFSELAEVLSRREGVRICVVGTERPDTLLSRSQGRIVNLIGRTDLCQLAALLEKASLVVGVDSGIIHLAAAGGTPVVALYGPSDPSATGPQGEGHAVIRAGVDCSPCLRGTCRQERRCMTEIRTADVIAAAEQRLEAGRGAQK